MVLDGSGGVSVCTSFDDFLETQQHHQKAEGDSPSNEVLSRVNARFEAKATNSTTDTNAYNPLC